MSQRSYVLFAQRIRHIGIAHATMASGNANGRKITLHSVGVVR
jgi:hypothetical protein